VSSSENTPGNLTNNDFYDAAPLEPHLLYQGEILVDVPFLNMPKDTRWLLLRTKSGRAVGEALESGNLGGVVKVLDSNQSREKWDDSPDGDYAMARLSKRPVLVLSQTCDIQTKQFIQVAPIFDAVGAPDHIKRLQDGDIISAFWLPPVPQVLQESYADLELMQAVHQSYIRRLDASRHFRLTNPRILALQRFVTRYFGRPNSFDAGADLAPRSGMYLCVSCFYMDGKVTFQPRSEGEALDSS